MITLIEFLGALLIVFGVGLIYVPAAVILSGVWLIVLSAAFDAPKKSVEP